MNDNNVSQSSTDAPGYALIEKAWRVIHVMNNRLQNDPIVYTANDLRAVIETMVFLTHRLIFLEMAVKGLRHKELHDANVYAKFVERKYDLESLEFEQLKELLR